MAERERIKGRLIVAVRPASADDAEQIASIYDHHARTGTATFDMVGHSADWWSAKIADLSDRRWPFLVAVDAGAIRGYAYATQFRDRLAYAHSCEDSIYVAPDALGQGLGTALLSALIDSSCAAGFEQMIAVIGDAEPASVALHARLGFVERGRMIGVGRKFGRLLDTLYMQRALP